MSKEIEVREVIVSTIARRGKGERHSPIRAITQVFEKDGTLIAEHDPSPDTYTLTDVVDFARSKGLVVGASDVIAWLESIEAKR